MNPTLRHWTSAEDQVIREHYITRGAAAVVAMLPGRNLAGVCHRAKRLGVTRKRRWTTADDRRLRLLWLGGDTLAGIARRLGRSEVTTYWRAQKLGLPLGCPDGFEYLTDAALRTGYVVAQLRRILAASRVALRIVRARPTGATRHYHAVDPFDVDEAVAAWLRTETVESAASRRGVAGETLRTWLIAAGEKPPARLKCWRVPTATIDRVVASHRQVVSLCEAARRAGVDRKTMRARLAQQGFRASGRRWRVPVDALGLAS